MTDASSCDVCGHLRACVAQRPAQRQIAWSSCHTICLAAPVTDAHSFCCTHSVVVVAAAPLAPPLLEVPSTVWPRAGSNIQERQAHHVIRRPFTGHDTLPASTPAHNYSGNSGADGVQEAGSSTWAGEGG